MASTRSGSPVGSRTGEPNKVNSLGIVGVTAGVSIPVSPGNIKARVEVGATVVPVEHETSNPKASNSTKINLFMSNIPCDYLSPDFGCIENLALLPYVQSIFFTVEIYSPSNSVLAWLL
jgi:hypothetical protein